MISPDKRTRPLPPNGLELAVRVGRRRRQTALGVGGGFSALVVALALLAGTWTGEPRASLTYDEPGPRSTPAPSVAPGINGANGTTATTDVSPSASSASPAGKGNPSPGSTSPPSPHSPSETGPGSRAAPAFTESPAMTASTSCSGVSAQTDGYAYCGSSSGPKEPLGVGQGASVSLRICKAQDTHVSLALGFASGQEQELLLTGPKGELWRFSHTVRFAQVEHSRELRTGTCLTWDLRWSGLDAAGEEVGPGRYRLTHSVVPSTINGEPSDTLGEPQSWDITITA